ncbi:MAG: hypothetical protein H6814_09050 [Phycisphaeraceae bacterium]|nr:hypothetical protein [Phycisphaeraceae bacterium]
MQLIVFVLSGHIASGQVTDERNFDRPIVTPDGRVNLRAILEVPDRKEREDRDCLSARHALLAVIDSRSSGIVGGVTRDNVDSWSCRELKRKAALYAGWLSQEEEAVKQIEDEIGRIRHGTTPRTGSQTASELRKSAQSASRKGLYRVAASLSTLASLYESVEPAPLDNQTHVSPDDSPFDTDRYHDQFEENTIDVDKEYPNEFESSPWQQFEDQLEDRLLHVTSIEQLEQILAHVKQARDEAGRLGEHATQARLTNLVSTLESKIAEWRANVVYQAGSGGQVYHPPKLDLPDIPSSEPSSSRSDHRPIVERTDDELEVRSFETRGLAPSQSMIDALLGPLLESQNNASRGVGSELADEPAKPRLRTLTDLAPPKPESQLEYESSSNIRLIDGPSTQEAYARALDGVFPPRGWPKESIPPDKRWRLIIDSRSITEMTVAEDLTFLLQKELWMFYDADQPEQRLVVPLMRKIDIPHNPLESGGRGELALFLAYGPLGEALGIPNPIDLTRSPSGPQSRVNSIGIAPSGSQILKELPTQTGEHMLDLVTNDSAFPVRLSSFPFYVGTRRVVLTEFPPSKDIFERD